MARATNPPARLNRALLGVSGLVLLAAAALAAGIAIGRLPLVAGDAPVLGGALPSWWPWAATVGAVVVGLAGLRWLLAQTHRRPVGDTWTVTADGPLPGSTSVAGGVTEAAVRADLTDHAGVADARVRLTDGAPRPTLYVELDLDTEADARGAVEHLSLYALPRLRQALGVPAVPTRLLLRSGRARTPDRVA
ncbi:hypothetical protein [Actinomycetospora aeridis]|uniref:Alkaline shock response membrane anchor protein AmaP n=1 Tax=Actinomycetospora aeridis TaxID=3129231 RepID=A0ABU8NAU8_9PSEU